MPTPQPPRYELPSGWEILDPPAGVPRPLDPIKSLSNIRRAVLERLNRAGRPGLTEDQCGDIAYPGEPTKRKKQGPMIRNICQIDGHPLALCPAENRVALARHFARP